MTETLSARQASFELVEDHRRLQGLVGSLASAADARALAEALVELHGAVSRHFNEEEKPGGLYDALGVCAPKFRSRLGVLVDDHFRLAGMIRDLAERARTTAPAAFPALRADAEHLAAALADHERREQEMVEAATGRT